MGSIAHLLVRWAVGCGLLLALTALCGLGHLVQVFCFLVVRSLFGDALYRRAIGHTQVFFIELVILTHACSDLVNLCSSSIELYGAAPADRDWILGMLGDRSFGLQDSDGGPAGLDQSVLLCNHLTMLDWIYVWIAAYHLGGACQLRIVLKSSLARVPLYGWGMRFFEFVFLQRAWQTDLGVLERACAKLRRRDPRRHGCWLLVFPEGTLLTRNRIAANLAYASRANIEAHPHTLIPRTTGAHFIISKLRQPCAAEPSATVFGHLIHVTIAYGGVPRGGLPDDVYPFWRLILSGSGPARIHLRLQRVRMSSVPEDRAEFDAWLLAEFARKSRMLAHFEKNVGFPDCIPVARLPVVPVLGWVPVLRATAILACSCLVLKCSLALASRALV